MKITPNKTQLSKAIFNYLQQGKYRIDYEYCGSKSSDDEAIAYLIELKDLSFDEVKVIVEDEYFERLSQLNEVTIEDMTKALSISLCSAWIGKSDKVHGYDYSTRYLDTLFMGDSTMYMIK
jgi:hypothetical protein